jgi:hypothetical protein
LVRETLLHFNAIRNHTQRKRFHFRAGLGLGRSIGKNSRQTFNLGNPAAIFFAIERNLEFHGKDLQGHAQE